MELTRIFDILELHTNIYKKTDALNAKENGEWKHYSSEEYKQITTYFSYGLLELGLQKGDNVALISNNRPDQSTQQ